jgi:hypothetical protein
MALAVRICEGRGSPIRVMAGLVPAIHDFLVKVDVNTRV